MEQYEEWQDEDGNVIRQVPIQNYYVSPGINQLNYFQERMISPNYEKIYASPREMEQFDNFIITTSNQNMADDYDYPQYSYEDNQSMNYSNQYYNQRNNNDIYNINNTNNTNSSINNINSSLRKYESSDGVLRGYTNNYSFYVSGSSQIKPKVTINNEYNNNKYIVNDDKRACNYQNKNSNQNKNQIIYNNSRQIQRNTGQQKKVAYSNSNSNINNNKNHINRQIIQKDNSSYIIRTVENEPVIYTQPNIQNNNYYSINYNNNEEEDEIYYIKENENRNEIQQTNYQRPLIQRRMVKRVVDKEPSDSRKDYYIIGPNDNQRNINKKSQITNYNYQQKSEYQRSNNYNIPNNNFKKFYSSNINERTSNINQRNDYFSPYPLKRTNTPNMPRPNFPSNANYTRQISSRQQKIMGQSPNFYRPKKSNNNESYQRRGNIYAYTINNDYFYNQTEANSPRVRTPYIAKSPLMDNNNIYIYPTRREREYNSRTQLQNQTGNEYEYEIEENDDNDDVYEVPERFNDGKIVFYEDRRQNASDRPFMRVSNYSGTEREGKKYGAYTQTLAMNKNYNHQDEYEVDRRNVRNMRRYTNRDNYSVPKIMRPISDVQRLVRQKRDYSAFERSLKNIRDNEEEIELENEERNNRVRIKTTGSNNHRLYISNNSKGHPSRRYKTYTQLESDRPQGYVMQDIDDDSQDEYYMPNINRNKNIVKNNNLRIINQREENRYQPPPPRYRLEEVNNYYDEENMDSYQNINTQTHNEENGEEDHNDEEEQMYDSNRLITAKEDNFRIAQNNERNRREEINQKEFIQNSQNSDKNQQKQDNEIEGENHEEEEIQQINANRRMKEDLYQREDSPRDGDDNVQDENKNVKNIQTEINEKYYDNQGNYLGEKKIITTKQVPANNQNSQREEDDYQDEQDEQEEQEDNEENDNEYTPYQSNHTKYKKRGDINNNIIESKYHSYFGNSNNNVYYEVKGASGEVNREKGSDNYEEINKGNYKEPMIQVKNDNFGIQSENLCVPGNDNDNNENNFIEEKDNIDDKGNNEEKEADEQKFDENAEIDEEEEEEKQNLNENKEKEEKSQNFEEEKNENKNDKENENEQGNAYKDVNENFDKNGNSNEKDIKDINDINESIDIKQEENEINKYDDIKEEQVNDNNIEDKMERENIETNNNEEIEINNDMNNNIQFEEKNVNINDQNNAYENNEIFKDNKNKNRNFEYNEVEQIIEENDAEEIENQNIQKDEEEEDIGEGLVDLEDNNNYEENEMEGEEGFEEQKEENNENDNEGEDINKEEYENEKDN